MIRSAITAATTLAAAITLGFTAPTSPAPSAPTPVPTSAPADSTAAAIALYESIASDSATPDCEVEDGSELTEVGQVCRWIGTEAGNGVGDSYIVMAVVAAETFEPGLIYVYSDGTIEL